MVYTTEAFLISFQICYFWSPNQPLMEKILQSRFLPYCIIILFIILKIPHLDYPFFWDESWPYSSAIHEMYKNGPSLSPDAISPELSRGHPTLFVFLTAVWMKIFGTSFIAIHSFPLLISALFGVGIYETGRRLFTPATGLLALILVIFQPLFFVQSSLVLLEISLAFAGLLCLYFYAKNKLPALTVSLLVLFFIKESGLAVGLALGITSLIRLLLKDLTPRQFAKHLLVFVIPLSAVVIFFIIQKQMLGWYFFPYHMELLSTDPGAIKNKIKAGFKLLFLEHNREHLSKALVLIVLITGLVYIKKLAVTLNIQWLLTRIRSPWNSRKLFILTVFLLLPIFIVYSGMNMFINRYFLIVFVPLNIIMAAILVYCLNRIYRPLTAVLLLVLGIFHYWNLKTTDWIADDAMGAFNMMRMEQAMTVYLEDHYAYNTVIASDAYLLRVQLTDPKTRYLRSEKVFTNVSPTIGEATQVVIFSAKEGDYQYETVKTGKEFKLVKRFELGKAWAEIYERKSE